MRLLAGLFLRRFALVNLRRSPLSISSAYNRPFVRAVTTNNVVTHKHTSSSGLFEANRATIDVEALAQRLANYFINQTLDRTIMSADPVHGSTWMYEIPKHLPNIHKDLPLSAVPLSKDFNVDHMDAYLDRLDAALEKEPRTFDEHLFSSMQADMGILMIVKFKIVDDELRDRHILPRAKEIWVKWYQDELPQLLPAAVTPLPLSRAAYDLGDGLRAFLEPEEPIPL